MLQLIHNSGVTGPGRVVSSIARNLDRQDFSTDVLCPSEGYLADELRKAGVRIVALDPWRPREPLTFFKIWQELRREKYHIFHVHSGQLNAFSKVIGRLLGIPAVVLTEHLCAKDHGWIKDKFKLFLHLLFHRISNAMADKIICVSDTGRASLIRRQKLPPEKVVTIYNGIDIRGIQSREGGREDIRKQWGVPENALVVGMVARFSPEKGHQLLVKAAKIILEKSPNVKFVLVGEGPQRPVVEHVVEKMGIADKFIFTGFQSDIYSFIESMDVVVQPSFEAGESFGLAAVEAMAKQKAVVASDIGCFREVIVDGTSGLLFASGDHTRLAEKILLLLNDSRLRQDIGSAAKTRAEDNFDETAMVTQIGDLYKEALAEKAILRTQDYLKAVAAEFMDILETERGLAAEKISGYRAALRKYIFFIEAGKLEADEIKEYLAYNDTFLIETFLEFCRQRSLRIGPVCDFNNRLFGKVIKHSGVTSRDYDERIRMQTPQFQIDNYYFPAQKELKSRIEIIMSLLDPQPEEKILDAGCGVGTFVFHCAKKGAQATGVDYSSESIQLARQLVERFGVSRNASFTCGDIASGLDFPDGHFDKIAAVDFIEHIDEALKRKLLSEMSRLIGPRGRIVIFTPNGIREALGSVKSALTGLCGAYSPETRLHFGLLSRFAFEKMLKEAGFTFTRHFFDVGRPYLAKIPLLKELLSLNIAWVIKKTL